MTDETPIDTSALIDGLDTSCERALLAADRLLHDLRSQLQARLARDGTDDALNREQARAHGFAWAATYVRALRETLGWAQRLQQTGAREELESLILQAAFGEYLAQLAGGLPMSQGEIFRPELIDRDGQAVEAFLTDPDVKTLRLNGFSPVVRGRITELISQGRAVRYFGNPGYEDPALAEIRTQFGRWSDDHAEAAHGWHLRNDLIPDSVIAELGELGVFGLTVPEAWGGSGMGKIAMCVVTEELSRSWIGLGSLGTRTEIACELILLNGTDAQKRPCCLDWCRAPPSRLPHSPSPIQALIWPRFEPVPNRAIRQTTSRCGAFTATRPGPRTVHVAT
jgi:(2S)-methylsuccinyl-CoA dehydrogenase